MKHDRAKSATSANQFVGRTFRALNAIYDCKALLAMTTEPA
ncbi:MAG: hypothetical protein AB7U20_03020 [Planctomycetaceae bacterium]